jgi:xylulokinase
VVGYANGEPGLPRGTPLVTGAQDAYLAFWAAGMDLLGRAVDPGGRTGGLAVAVQQTLQVEGLWTFSSAARGVSIAGGAVNAHGIAVEWLAGVLNRSVDELLELAAEAPAGARGALFLPYLEGERAPRWDSRLRGVVAGLDSATSAAELTRAVLEGTACGLAHVASVLRAAGAHIDALVCAGSPARSELWCAIKGALLDVEVEVPIDLDLAAYGAALAAGAGAGWWPRPGEGDPGSWPRPPMRRVPPLTSAGLYADALRRFVAAGDIVQENLAIFGTNADNTTNADVTANANASANSNVTARTLMRD